MQMLQCDNKHLTWSMTELSCLFNQRRSSSRLRHLPSFCDVSSASLSFLAPSPPPLRSYFSLPPSRSLSFLLSPLTFSPLSSFLRIQFLGLLTVLPPFHHSAVFTVIHYHFFRQLALTVLSFVRSHWRRPPWGRGNDRRRPLFTSVAPTVSSA